LKKLDSRLRGNDNARGKKRRVIASLSKQSSINKLLWLLSNINTDPHGLSVYAWGLVKAALKCSGEDVIE
jgi:hypothetical protein